MNKFKELDNIIKKGNHKIKGYINKKVDVILPKEEIAPHIDELLKVKSPESLAVLIKVNFIVKSFLTITVSNIESMIDNWVYIQKRKNPLFSLPINELSVDKLLNKKVCDSKNKAEKLLFDNFIDQNKNIYKLIINGTLGFKKRILLLMSKNNLKWFLHNKKEEFNMEDTETFFDYLETCKILRNEIIHNSFVLNKKFWVKIYNKSINKKYNRDISGIETEELVEQIFIQASTFLNKTGNNNIKERLISDIRKKVKDDSIIKKIKDWEDRINLSHFLNKYKK